MRRDRQTDCRQAGRGASRKLSGSHELGNVRDVDEKEGLENLGDDLMGSDQKDDLPFGPIANPADIAENDAEERIWPRTKGPRLSARE